MKNEGDGERKEKRDIIPLKNIDRCRNRRVCKGRKREEERDERDVT